jgi:hypothetical protein
VAKSSIGGSVAHARTRRAVLTTLLVLVAAGSASASLARPQPRNLVATPQAKQALLTTVRRHVPSQRRARVRGPLSGSLYYGSYGSAYYAVADFWFPLTGSTDQPEVFSRTGHGGWRDRGDTGDPYICVSRVPAPLLRLWGFIPDPLVRGCFDFPRR